MQRYRVLTLFALFPPIFSRSSASEWKEEGKGTAKNAKILFPLSFPRTATWLSSPLFFLIVLPQCFKTSVEKKKWLYIVFFQIVLAALSLNSSTSLDFTPNYNFLLQKLYKNHNSFFTLKKAVSSGTKHCCATAFASTSFGV